MPNPSEYLKTPRDWAIFHTWRKTVERFIDWDVFKDDLELQQQFLNYRAAYRITGRLPEQQ